MEDNVSTVLHFYNTKLTEISQFFKEIIFFLGVGEIWALF